MATSVQDILTTDIDSDINVSYHHPARFKQRRATFEGNGGPITSSNNYSSTSPTSMAASHVAKLAALFQAGKPTPSENLTASPRFQKVNQVVDNNEACGDYCAISNLENDFRAAHLNIPAVRPRVLFAPNSKAAPAVKSRIRHSNENINQFDTSNSTGASLALLSPPSDKMREKFQARRAKFEMSTVGVGPATSPKSPSSHFIGVPASNSINSKTSPQTQLLDTTVEEFGSAALRVQNRSPLSSHDAAQRNSRELETPSPQLRKPNLLSSRGSSPRTSSQQPELPSLEGLQFTVESSAPRIDMPILKRLSGDITGLRPFPVTPPRFASVPRPISSEKDSNKAVTPENTTLHSNIPLKKDEEDSESFPFPPRKLRASNSHRSASASSSVIESDDCVTSSLDTETCLLTKENEGDVVVVRATTESCMDSTNPRLSLCLMDEEGSFLFDAIASNEREIALSLNGVDDARNLEYNNDEFFLDDNRKNDLKLKNAVHISDNINGNEMNSLTKSMVRSILKLNNSFNGVVSSEMNSSGIEVICNDNLIEVEHVKEVAVEEGVHIFDDGHFFYELDTISMQKSGSISDSLFQHEATRVRFSAQPTVVYSTFSSNDYNRKNEDVDPISASAEFELEKRLDRMDLFEVELNKGTRGLGISILGMGVGAEMGLEKLGIFIKSLTVGGAAEQSGKIQVCDQIVQVDGVNLVGVTQQFASQVLRNTSGKVTLILGRDKDPNNSDVVRLVRQSLGDAVLPVALQQLHQHEENFKMPDTVDAKEEFNESSSLSNISSSELHIDTSMAPLAQAIDCSDLLSPLSTQEDDSCDSDDVQERVDVDGAPPISSHLDVDDDDDFNGQSLCARCEAAECAAAAARSEVEQFKVEVALLKESCLVANELQLKMEARLRHERLVDSSSTDDDVMLAESDDLKDRLVLAERAAEHQRGKYEKVKRLLKESESANAILLQEGREREAYFNNLIAGLKDRIVILEDKIRLAKSPPSSIVDSKSTPTPASIVELMSVHTLDVSIAKQKAILGRSGGLSGRKPPSRHIENTSFNNSSSSSEDEQSSSEDNSENEDIAETFADQWNTIKRANPEAFKHRSASYDLNQDCNGCNSSTINDSGDMPDFGNVNNSVHLVSSSAFNEKDSSPQLIRSITSAKSAAESGGGVQLVGVKALSDLDGLPSWLNSACLATESNHFDENRIRSKCYNVNSAQFGVSQWSEDETRQWLLEGAALERPKAAAEALRGVTGAELLKMDNAQLKSRGMNHSSDRAIVRKRLKELQHQQLSAASNSSKLRKIFNFGK